MFGRFDEETTYSYMPSEWQENLIKILTNTYADQIEKNEKLFDVIGLIYDKEFVVIVSYIDQKDYSVAPISLFISHDHISDVAKMSQTLDRLADFVGEVFDDIFSTEDWNDYLDIWTENKYRDHLFHYKITRENVTLTLQANELLKEEEGQ